MPTFVLVYTFPRPWPPPKPCHIIERLVNDWKIALSIDTQGRIRFHAVSTGIEHNFISQRLVLDSNGYGDIIIAWDAVICEVIINGTKLIADGPQVPSLHVTLKRSPEAELSITSPNAVSACQAWITNRKAKFSGTPTPCPAHRMKTIDEEGADLSNALLSIHDLCIQVKAGKEYHLGSIAANLRALIYWQRDSVRENTYDPLLFRMASKADLPLPVYLVHETEPSKVPRIVKEANERQLLQVPSLKKIFPTDRLTDVQEWLKNSLMSIPSLGQPIQVRDFIARVAMAEGASHYDSRVSQFVEIMQDTNLSEHRQLVTFMCQVVELVVSLGNWVLAELSRLKVIT